MSEKVIWAAVFGMGHDGEVQVYDWKLEDVRKKYDELWGRNLRLHTLEPYVVEGNVRWAAVWRPGNAAEIQVYDWALADVRKKYDELWPQGMRLHLLQPYVVNGQVRWAAVWRPGNTAEIQVYDWSLADLRKKYDELWPQGMRLHLLRPYTVNGQVRWAAVWRPGNSAEIQIYDWFYPDMRKKYDELWAQGFRLAHLQPYRLGKEVRWAAVWRPDTSGEIQVYDWSLADVRAEYDALWGQGMRLKMLRPYCVAPDTFVRPTGVDLRPTIAALGLEPRSQGIRGTCSVFASTFLLEYMTGTRTGVLNLDYSEEYLNAVTNMVSGRSDDGDFFCNIASGYAQYGIVSEAQMPYDPEQFDAAARPSAELLAEGQGNRAYVGSVFYSPHSNHMGLSDAQLEMVKSCLDSNIPVAGGFHITAALEVVQIDGHTVWDRLTDNTDGWAHSMPIVGYQRDARAPGGGYVIVRNSAGPDADDHGYLYMSYHYVQNYAYDVVTYTPQSAAPRHHLMSFEKRVPARSRVMRPPPLPLELMLRLGKLRRPRAG